MPLCDMRIGQQAIVTDLCASPNIKRRLLDLGLIEGTKVKCVMISPFGNPIAYDIRGSVIAIRNEDCRNIRVDVL